MGPGLIDEPLRLDPTTTGASSSPDHHRGFPFAFLLILSYLSGIDPTPRSGAAATLGADWKQRFRRITLPLLAPGLATTFCLTFVLAFSVFPSAILVGDPSGATRVIPIAAYQAGDEQYDYPFASAIAMIMGVVELIVIVLVLLWRSRSATPDRREARADESPSLAEPNTGRHAVRAPKRGAWPPPRALA